MSNSADAPSHRTRYGTANPEIVENDLWQLARSNTWNGHALCNHLGAKRDGVDWKRGFSHSAYRDTEPGPFWSWERFGRTSTKLPDGRVIHVAGEHEDSYDPDFCIYNDIVVDHPDGSHVFHLYPKDVFPPTDFHSATLVGHDLLLIGSLGYGDLRRPGVTQVLKLDTRTLAITAVVTTGDGPGWISRHQTEHISNTSLLIVGGKVQTASSYADNPDVFELDLTSLRWTKRAHGDTSVFPITRDDYMRLKAPAYGTANPERITNPFRLAMADKQWPPSRARLHFGDALPRETEKDDDIGDVPARGTPEYAAWFDALTNKIKRKKERRPREAKVWTTCRTNAAIVILPDGRRLQIGGEVLYYGDEADDAWSYTDIVETGSDGSVGIFAYPRSVFPHLQSVVAHVHEGHVTMFGFADGDREPDLRRELIVMRLDVSSFEIARVPVLKPEGFRLAVYPGCDVREGRRVIFPNQRRTNDDPELGIAFDLDTLTWGEPFPHAAPVLDEEA